MRNPDGAAATIIAAVAALIVSVATIAPAAAQSPDTAPQRVPATDPITTISRGAKFRVDPVDPPDWIKKTRPANGVAPARPRRAEPQKPMTADQLRAVEASLDADRARHDRLAGRRSPGASKSLAYDPVVRKKKTRPPCVVTCNTGLGRVKGKWY